MNKYIEWKKKRGLDIEAVSLEDIYLQYNGIADSIGNTLVPVNNVTISGNAAMIRMYLKDVHGQGGAKWILLVGDNANTIRKYRASDYIGREVKPITDKYFADYNSDYAVDSDTDYGERKQFIAGSYIGDNVDRFPESFVGRIPASDTSEFNNWVNKLLTYEMHPGKGDSSYLKNYILCMADEMQLHLQNSSILFNSLDIFDTTIFKELPYYYSNPPTATTGATIISNFNIHPAGWWSWNNHGLSDKMFTMTDSTNIAITPQGTISTGNGTNGLLSLTNNERIGIISAASCNVANFEGSNDCMMEQCLFNPNGGSVAFVGNTELGWINQGIEKIKRESAIIDSCHNNMSMKN